MKKVNGYGKCFLVTALVFLFFSASAVFALEASLIGGYRSSGVAASFTLEQPITDRTNLRIGAVGSSGTPQSIYLLGLKTYVGNFQNIYPTYIVIGLSPETSMINNGAGASLLFANVFGLAPMFIETGVDVSYGIESTALAAVRLQLMVGYNWQF
ncbi:MAG: hypothetical protein COZ72_04200 [Elusimicrobia bacterium CG_4_8_14_3_um_filter_50_9]|nr:MAG: hypothetical protein COZ72_04200 [Elusimicrobia bacterium CG_4_8_14_3_um_filter_50_9]